MVCEDTDHGLDLRSDKKISHRCSDFKISGSVATIVSRQTDLSGLTTKEHHLIYLKSCPGFT
jgi:hypothetical protein